MSAFASKFRTRDFFDVNFNASGLFSGKGVMRFIGKILPDVQIENLSKTFACVACDLNTEKEIVFKTGSLRNAVRSSMSIPGIFVPVSIDDMLLVDGGIINNLPEDVAMEMGADVIISVDVMSNYHMKSKPKNIVDAIFASMNIQTKEVQRLKACYSDIVLTPDTSELSQMRFGKDTVTNAINAGIEATNKHIKEIKKLVK